MSITHSERRSDIEGLRALAVLLVVAYHYGVTQFSGGFVGVDVFFVISGFLITKLLIDEGAREGGIKLGNFWARRIRRIIPMALLVVVVTVIAGLYMLEPGRARELSTVALGAVGFCANFVLYYTTGSYLSGVTPPSPLQHYWSLAIEEQFYLVWPLILFVVVKFGRKYWRRWLAAAVVIFGGSSLIYSIAITRSQRDLGYYMPHARIWEILAGAGLATVGVHIFKIPQRFRAAIGWAGLLLIIWSAVSFDNTTVFPGSAALLPVLGTVAVITAVETSWGPQRILRISPAQRIGAWSYSLYLWHWPALVLVEARFGIPSVWTKIWLFIGCLVLSAITYTYVEQPARRHAWLTIRPWRSIVAGLTAITIGLTGALVLYGVAPRLHARVDAATPPISLAEGTGSAIFVRPSNVAVSVPNSVVRSKNLVNVFLLGDSTMASLRWFEQGTVALEGFNYKLDVESCRRIADPSCYGREKRVPTSALRAFNDFTGPLDYVVLMAGYDSSVRRVGDELRRLIAAINDKNVKVVILTYKESLKFPSPGSSGQRSVYADFNKILKEEVAKDESGNVVIADWNLFSWGQSEWFLKDGIHLKIEGAVALGWYISHLVATIADNACPFTDVYPCGFPERMDPRVDLMTQFSVKDTEIQCYEDGSSRKRVCTRDHRL